MKTLFIGIGIGGVIGSAITFFAMNKKLEKRVNEIVSKNNINDTEETNDNSEDKKDNNEYTEYMEKSKEYDTTSDDTTSDDASAEDVVSHDDESIYFISKDEYIHTGDHSTETLYYFNDNNILTDEDNNKIDDVYGYIGNCNLKKTFEKYGEDTLYIRNDDKYVDYEIINTNSYIDDYLN